MKLEDLNDSMMYPGSYYLRSDPREDGFRNGKMNQLTGGKSFTAGILPLDKGVGIGAAAYYIFSG